MVRIWLVLTGVFLASCSAATCRETCDGCCKKSVCVPLASTNRTQCGRGGEQCVNGELNYCPVCMEGICSTGPECFYQRPAICECGSKGNSECGYDCGQCPDAGACVDHRCAR